MRRRRGLGEGQTVALDAQAGTVNEPADEVFSMLNGETGRPNNGEHRPIWPYK
jgi:hypothetical protein